jgi:aminoglycoside phosphotransferase (APT) family kinase protein
MHHDTTLTRHELDRLTDAIVPEWRIREAAPAEAGHHAVYRLAFDAPDGDRTAYLKATPEGKALSVDLEARLLALLGERTSIPVPDVYGVVDEHPDLPAPFALLAAMPGEAIPRTELPELSDERLAGIARRTGRHLAALHAVDAVDAFGFLTAGGPPADGDPPRPDPDRIAVVDPEADWRDRLHDWADGTLAALRDTRFADLAPRVDPALRERIDALSGPFEPSLSRIDGALENVLLDGDRVTAALDWEFTLAATPAYDLTCVTWSLAGGPFLFAPETPDRRGLVREALLAGYADRGSHGVVDRVRTERGAYELLSATRSMVHLADWFAFFDLGDRIDGAAADLRAELDRLLDGE